jgi:hypothetical protein
MNMTDKDNYTNLYDWQVSNKEKNNLHEDPVKRLSVISNFPAQKWMMEMKRLELKMKKITSIF